MSIRATAVRRSLRSRRQWAELEFGEAAIAFASGMAAIHAALLAAGVRAGSTVVAAMDVYGATFTLLQRLFSELGVRAIWVDVADLDAVETACASGHPSALVAETISNPLLKVADIPALVEIAHRHAARVLIDNTFASPWLCNPRTLGADFVMHSATKYIGGHGDVMAGVVVTSNTDRKTLYELNKLVGGVLGPFEAWLALRGLKTLPLRVRQQCANAQRIATWLMSQSSVAQVNYPGLPQHRQHGVARRLFGDRGFGGVLSFEIAGANRTRCFVLWKRWIYACRPRHWATFIHSSFTPRLRLIAALRPSSANRWAFATVWCDFPPGSKTRTTYRGCVSGAGTRRLALTATRSRRAAGRSDR